MKRLFQLLLSAGLGSTVLAGCMPARSVSIEFGDRPVVRRVKVVRRPPAVQLFRIQTHPRTIVIKHVPPGHARGHGKGHGRGHGKGH